MYGSYESESINQPEKAFTGESVNHDIKVTEDVFAHVIRSAMTSERRTPHHQSSKNKINESDILPVKKTMYFILGGFLFFSAALFAIQSNMTNSSPSTFMNRFMSFSATESPPNFELNSVYLPSANTTTCNTSLLISNIVRAYNEKALEFGIDINSEAQLASLKDGINSLYIDVWNLASYESDNMEYVNNASSFLEIIEALDSVLREPIAVYASYNYTDIRNDLPGELETGEVYTGGLGTKVHLFPATTGLSELDALRKAINTALDGWDSLTEPSLERLTDEGVLGENDIILNPTTGNLWLLNDVLEVKLIYTIRSSGEIMKFPATEMYTMGNFMDSSANWQGIYGARIYMSVNVDVEFNEASALAAGDVVTVSLSKTGLYVSSSSGVMLEVMAELQSLDEDGFPFHKPFFSLAELASMQAVVNDGALLGETEIGVWGNVVGSGDSDIVLSSLGATLMDGIEVTYSFP